MAEPQRITIDGQVWTVVRRSIPGHYGLCDYDTRTISLTPRMRGRTDLDTTIHEILHAQMPWASEEAVARWASDLAAGLWGMGWRKK